MKYGALAFLAITVPLLVIDPVGGVIVGCCLGYIWLNVRRGGSGAGSKADDG